VSAVAAIPSIALLAGCAFGFLLPDVPSWIHAGLMLAVAVGAVWAWRHDRPEPLFALLAAGFFAGGALLAGNAWERAWRPSLRIVFESLPADEPIPVTGVLRADASPTPVGASISVDVREIETPCPRSVAGGVLLTVVGDLARSRVADWRAGRVVRTTAVLRRPSRYLDPGVPDEERALARRGTTLVGSVKSGALVEVVSHGGLASETAAAIRAFARRSISASVGRWSARAAGIVTAIVIGDRTGLDSAIERRLQEAGTYHVIAISGGNIAILAGLTLAAFRVAGVLGRAAMLTAIAGLIAYGFLVGGGASVNRATLMAVLYFSGRALDLRSPPLNTLALAAGLLAAVDPLVVADAGFLLTFGATGAILVGVPALPLRRFPRFIAPLAAMLAASAAAEAALFPVAALLFARVTFAGLALNFAAIPLMAVTQIAGMALVPLAIVSVKLASAIGWIAYMSAEGLVRSAEFVRFVPAVTWRVAQPGWPFLVLYYAGIIVLWATRRYRRFAAACAMAGALWILVEPWRFIASRGDGRLHVVFMDVGQGDAAFVKFPRGTTLIVDTGGLPGASAFDIGDRVVAPVLRSAGFHRVDTLAVTHGDADHSGGAASILDEFRPLDVWEGIPVPPHPPMIALKSAAMQRHARWTNLQTADRMTIDDVEVVVRHPGLPDWERQDVRNDDSIVLELLWRDVSVVLTGDIGRDVERAITPLFPPSRLRIIKVPHHGSLTSSSPQFVEALAPRVAVVSAGRNNPFGHPAPAVVDRYERVGATVFRTDLDGAVTVQSDGESIDVTTFMGRRLSVR
jgi:competence protein ComEC